jgi:hypothetical protein
MSVCTVLNRKRARDEDDEDMLLAMVIAYADYLKAHKTACVSYEASCAAIIHAYVQYRGGISEVEVFEVPATKFDAHAVCAKAFTHNFRFTHVQMDRLVLMLLALGVPKVIKTSGRDSCSLFEALCMMCMKYAWPTRLGSMVTMFGSSMSRMSRIVSALRRILFDMFAPALSNPALLSVRQLENFATAIRAKSGNPRIFGFIDGTVRPISKPKHLQASVYNGKDKVHALKYQALVTPDGMLQQLAGPWPGSRHDMYAYHKSKLKEFVQALPRSADGTTFAVYADQGYAASSEVETPYFDGAADAMHEAMNQAMASSRIAVEWAFGDIVAKWASLDMKRTQQLLSNRKIGQVYLVAGLLTNFMNCFKPNQGSQYFGVDPPSLEDYMAAMASHVRGL